MISYICKGCGLDIPDSNYRVHKKGYRIGKCRACERKYQRAFYANGGEVTRKRKREHMAKLRAERPEHIREKQRAHYALNRDEICKKRREHHVNRIFWTRALKVPGVNAKQLASLWKKQRGLCALTGEALDRTAQVDHKLPKARGGCNSIENLQWVTASANLAKRDLTDEEFYRLSCLVVRWIGERINACL